MQGDEIAHITCKLDFHWQSTIDTGGARIDNRAHGRWTVKPTWNRVFRHLGPELMDEASEEYLTDRLSDLCLEMSRDDLFKEEPSVTENTDEDNDSQVGRIYVATVTIESFNDVKVQFAAPGLIENGTKRRPPSDTRTYWRLTERGNDQLMRLRTIRKPTVTNLEPVLP